MGRDKAWLPFGQDATLIERMVRLVSQVVDPAAVVVVGGTEQSLPNLPDETRVVNDRWPGEGPLVGVATGLAALTPEKGRPEIGWSLVCCCDLPLLKPEVLQLLIETARQSESNPDCDGVIPRVDERWQPLTAIYRTRLLPRVNQLLQRGRRRMTDLLEAIAVRELGEDELRQVDRELRSFRHCNTPEEYESLLPLAEH